MKLYRKRDLYRCGIYCIRNIQNNKFYIGKSINIYERIRNHINRLNKNSKDENEYFKRSWIKYGRNSFEYIVLEDIDNTKDGYEELIKERELYWMKYHNSLENGYNVRYDSETKTKVNSLTRQKMSENMKKRWKENREEMIQYCKNIWKNKESLERMKKSLSKIKQKYYFDQYDKDKTFIKRWNSVKEIIKENPSYKWNNIYAVCSGEKPSMYGFVWKKVLKEDIVQS